MHCWRCQSNLSESEHVQAVAWDLCQRCQEELRPQPPVHATGEAERAPDTALAAALYPELATTIYPELATAHPQLSTVLPGLHEPTDAFTQPRRRAIAVCIEDGPLIAVCAGDVELGNVMDVARIAGPGRRVILQEVES